MPLALTFLVNLEGFVVASHSTGPAVMNSATKSTNNTFDDYKVIDDKRIGEMEKGYS